MMRLCSGPGCGRAIPEDSRYCDACKAERGIAVDNSKQMTPAAASGVYDATLDHLRKGTRWQRLRAVVVKLFPFCARCGVAAQQSLITWCQHMRLSGKRGPLATHPLTRWQATTSSPTCRAYATVPRY